MARIACTTMDGGGNVSVFRGLRDELAARGHDVRLTVGPWGGDVDLEGDVVVVGHAGHGGIMATLRHGVPMVCIPLDRDQPANASRVAAVGAGVTVDTGAPIAAFRGTIDAAMRDEGLRANARRLSVDIAALDGAPADAVASLL